MGVDVGGTGIKIGLVDDRGQTLAWKKIPTNVADGPDNAVARIGQVYREMLASAKVRDEEVLAVGLGTPGTMDIPAGKFLEPVNLPGWEYYPIRDKVGAACGKPVAYVNDANAAAYGEFWVGSGADYYSLILITLGTGVGGGIIIGDLNIEGQHSHGCEIGHIIIDMSPDARICGCGHAGHLEGYASATGLVRRTQDALPSSRSTSIRRRMDAGEQLTPIMLAEEAERGDEFALRMVMETARYLGVGITTLMHTIDPDAVILGGAMTFGEHETELGRRFIARVRDEVRQRAFPIPAEKTVIDYATLGADAGYIGAAGMGRLMMKQKK